MKEQLLRQQRALSAGILTSDARAKQRSEEITLGVVRQYDLILGFLECIKPALADYPELNIFYFPVESNQLLCVYRTKDRPQPIPVEFPQPISVEYRPYQADTRLRAYKLFEQAKIDRFLSFDHPPLDIRGHHETYRHQIINLILAVFDGYLPRTYPKGATSLIVCCSIPEQITVASGRLRDLSGILVLFGDKGSFSQTSHPALAEILRKEFNKYFAEVGHYAIRELEFFLSSLMSQDERIQDNQNRALGFIAHMVAHRFRNFRQVAEFITQEFPTAEAVSCDPQFYEKQIQAMKNQLDRAQPLEKQLEYIGQVSQKIRLPVKELLETFNDVLNEMKKQLKTAVLYETDIPDNLRNEYVTSPQNVLEEVFGNHLENMLREIDRSEIDNKKLTLRVYAEGDYICLAIINYGPPLSSDILEDLQRTVRVRRPRGSGLGMFLSAMIMRHVGGDQTVESPIRGIDQGVCITLKFPRNRTKGDLS